MNLAQRSVRSSAYNIGSSVFQTAIAFVRSIILLRLLPPEVFGTYRFMSSFIFWTAALPMFGMGGALVHHARESEGEGALRIHFTLTLLFNIVWAVVLGVFGLFIIQDAQNRWGFLIIIISRFLVNLTQTARSRLIRKVAFRRIAFLNMLASILAVLFVVFLAWKGYGIWSLVSSDLIQAATLVLGLYVISPVWQPRLGWAKETVQYFLDFGRRNFLNQPLLRTLDRLDDLWVGFFLGVEALGFYSRAYRLASYPGNILATPLGSVATGTYAELKDAPKRLSQAFFRINAFLVRTGFLIGGLLTLVAPEFIIIVAGENWLPMVNVFRLMLIFTLLNPLKQTIAGLFMAVGKPEIVTKTRLVQLGVLIIALFAFGFFWGIAGVALAVDLMVIVGVGIMFHKAGEYVRISVPKLFLKPVFTLIISISVAYSVSNYFGPYASDWISAGIKTLLFVGVYLGLLLALEYNDLPLLLLIFRRLRN